VNDGEKIAEKMEFTYAYIPQSQIAPDRFYVGLRDDRRDGLRRHNGGEVSHTAEYRPWSLDASGAEPPGRRPG